MKRICLVITLAALGGCGGRYPYRAPVGGGDPAPPQSHADASPVIREDIPPSPHAHADPEPRRVDAEPSVEPPRPTESEVVTTVNGQLEDAFFGYDSFDLSPAAVAALRHDAELLRAILRDFPGLQVTVEGHCDERGSAEYNLGLGDRRAARAAAFLKERGLPSANLAPVSYGKQAPQCAESTEACRSRNRRAHFVVRTPITQ